MLYVHELQVPIYIAWITERPVRTIHQEYKNIANILCIRNSDIHQPDSQYGRINYRYIQKCIKSVSHI